MKRRQERSLKSWPRHLPAFISSLRCHAMYLYFGISCVNHAYFTHPSCNVHIAFFIPGKCSESRTPPSKPKSISRSIFFGIQNEVRVYHPSHTHLFKNHARSQYPGDSLIKARQPSLKRSFNASKIQKINALLGALLATVIPHPRYKALTP